MLRLTAHRLIALPKWTALFGLQPRNTSRAARGHGAAANPDTAPARLRPSAQRDRCWFARPVHRPSANQARPPDPLHRATRRGAKQPAR